MSGPLEPGERVLLIDGHARRFLIRLQAGATFHFHGGMVRHDTLIGADEGVAVVSSKGAHLQCFRPTMAEVILKMPRGAQVIYPKDIAAILVFGDIGPGVRVLEAGTGSAALTIALCRATGPEGGVLSYELREDFHLRARANVDEFFGKAPAWLDLRLGDVRGITGEAGGVAFDRVVLDMPEPWGVLREVATVLAPGGILCSYLPTTNQTQAAVLALEGEGFAQVQTFEVMLRTWHVTRESVRPDHRMVAHTGFITLGRKR